MHQSNFLGIFSYIIFVYMLSAVVQIEHTEILLIVYYLELSLAIYFVSEFLIRMWAIEADAKYQGFKGKKTSVFFFYV